MTQEQEAPCPMASEPAREHQWLEQLLGDWTFEGECLMGPDQPPWKSSGTESVRSLGGLWVLAEGQGEMPGGGESSMLMTIGFNPQTGRFVGTFVASMMTYLWEYDGELDDTGRVLTLYAEGPDMSPGSAAGKMARYKDVIEIVSADRRELSSSVLGDDGQWTRFMSAQYQRRAEGE